ncbi:hypothetical protein LBMAG47_25360 [Planctomycetia bacterium]|nr:hypothetical protein LBMAG47_25360 [Planctomycetia bacterium]
MRSKVKRGMDDAFRRGDNIQPPGVGYRFVDLKEANGNLVTTHKNTIEKVVEIDPEAADWSRRGAEMIACEGKSAVDVARLFNEHKVRGKQTWPDSRVRQHYGRDKIHRQGRVSQDQAGDGPADGQEEGHHSAHIRMDQAGRAAPAGSVKRIGRDRQAEARPRRRVLRPQGEEEARA